MDRIDNLLDAARASIGEFCIDSCTHNCCRFRYIKTKDPAEVRAIFGIPDGLLLENFRDYRLKTVENLVDDDITYRIELDPCPRLSEGICLIHESEARPRVCKDYPIFRKGGDVHFSDLCMAELHGRFSGFYQPIEEMGFHVVSAFNDGKVSSPQQYLNLKMFNKDLFE